MDFGNETIMYALIFLTTVYIAISILIEVLSILFLLTPTELDDKFINTTRKMWDKGKKYIDWFSIKTPLTKVLNKILGALAIAKKDLKVYLEKRSERRKN